MLNEERIMALDFGMKRIGVALSDPTKTIAFAYKTLLNTANVFFELETIISEKQVCMILIGDPSFGNEEKTEYLKKYNLFVESVRKRFSVPVTLIDETHSSKIAEQKIRESVTKKSKRREKGLVDQTAAAVLLQELLDSRGGEPVCKNE